MTRKLSSDTKQRMDGPWGYVARTFQNVLVLMWLSKGDENRGGIVRRDVKGLRVDCTGFSQDDPAIAQRESKETSVGLVQPAEPLRGCAGVSCFSSVSLCCSTMLRPSAGLPNPLMLRPDQGNYERGGVPIFCKSVEC